MRIDGWTFVLQTANVLVLIWLLQRFLYRPITSLISARRVAAEKLLSDAASVREAAEAEAAVMKHRLEGIAAEGEQIRADARTAAEAEQARIMQQAADTAKQTLDTATAAAEQERLAMERTLRPRICELALAIARRLLQRLPSGAITNVMLEQVAAAVEQLPDEQRRNLISAEGTILVTTAVALGAAAQIKCQELLAGLLGSKPAAVFLVDPSLIAGVELRTPEMLVRNSWSADLARIAEELERTDPDVAGSRQLA